MPTPHSCIAPLRHASLISLAPLKIDSQERLVPPLPLGAPQLHDSLRLARLDALFERRENSSGQGLKELAVGRIIGHCAEGARGRLEGRYLEDVRRLGQGFAESDHNEGGRSELGVQSMCDDISSSPRLDHLQKRANGVKASRDMGFPRPCVRHSDDRPRKSEEFVEGGEQVAPGAFVPRDIMDLEVPYIRRVHLFVVSFD